MSIALLRPLALIGVLLAHAGCRPGSKDGVAIERPTDRDVVAASSARKETNMVMDALFDKAVRNSGQAYLDADRALRDAGPSAAPTLRQNLNNPDAIARMVARTTLDWFEGSAADYQAVLDYLDSLPARLARTPIPSPSPLGVASYLSLHFGARAVDFLAVRLVKGTDWPHWRVIGVIFYLKEQAHPSATAALLRFAAETMEEELRGYAVEAIVAAHDADLKAKVAAERKYQAALGKQLPAAIDALASSGP
jgi:hypothetical protein